MSTTTDSDMLRAIQLRAYYLWERAGRPDGGDISFWDEARGQIDRERATGFDPAAR